MSPEMGGDPRHAAWLLLRSGSETPLRDVGPVAESSGLDARDRAFLRRLVGTEVRRRGTLRALVRHFARGKPDIALSTHLHLGLTQLFFMDRVPDHAAVSETVGAVHHTLGPSKARYTNAVLRAALRERREGHSGDPRRDLPLRDLHFAEPVFRDPAEHPLLWAEDALSMPPAIMKRWTARFGEETARALALLALDEPPLSLRVVRGERDALQAELTEAGAPVRGGRHPSILLAPSSEVEPVLSSAAFSEGRITVQGETALLAAEALQPREDESLLDLCAAPGGKTAVLAASGARVSACDVGEEKLSLVRSTLRRLALEDRVRLLASDGTRSLPEGELFDAALVDAPCTNTGVLAQRPEARWRFGPSMKRSLLALQSRLLTEAAARVRPGGRLVWSTCSLDPDENERQVAAFLAANPTWSLDLQRESLPDTATTQSEGRGPVDGGYFARLRHCGDPSGGGIAPSG
ncbi:MAG TPA: transcription antitermination factor NusB [Planctomycetota bacterium]|nr:transcription antitermination factor NusB [Planctomycetota bacterium]